MPIMQHSIATLLFPEYRRRVLGLLLLKPDLALHGREIARRTGLSPGTITRELGKLADVGLLRREKRGNQQVYSADTTAAVYPELAGILRKTSGLADVLVEALAPLDGISLAFVFGSVAQGHETANSDVDVMIVGSAAQPGLKPGLVDRLIVAAEASGIRPLVCINKVDLTGAAALVPLAGVFARMGYPVILCSAATGMGIGRLAAELTGRVTAVVGQSGVGKSSLINALDPGLRLHVAEVSRDNEKGRHTTTTARLLPHRFGGYFVDTPGVRQFQPWQLVPAEVPSAFRDLRPIANLCRFPDCTHDHEAGCAVKDAVADGLLDTRRWESCRQLAGGNEPREEDE